MSSFVINPYAFGGEDPDAKAYLDAVEVEDGQALEAGVRKAVDDFVKGLKADGIWSAIKACCILAGARTLDGALIPLVGPAPTNVDFVSGDYDREQGLLGDGVSKHLITNRNNNADPQNSKHVVLYITTKGTINARNYFGGTAPSSSTTIQVSGSSNLNINHNSIGFNSGIANTNNEGFLAVNRNNSSNYILRSGGSETTLTATSASPANASQRVFANAGGINRPNAQVSFYSIGESLDLADFDSRVTTLMTDLDAAI
jgi:hypothetical protein